MQKQSYFKRMNLWLNERFPLMNFISAFFIYFLAKSIAAIDQQQLLVDWRDFFGMLIPACHLFLLRVFDEHKDFETDAQFYPHRVVQRGLFTLSDIRKLGYLAILVQLLSYSFVRVGILSDLAFLLLWAWTLLMTKEFFCKDFLKRKLFLYGFLHLLITPILLMFLMTMTFKEISLGAQFLFPLGISIMTGWLYELSRKTKGLEEETGDLTYSRLWGVNKSLSMLLLSATVTLGISFLFFNALGIFNLYLAIIGLVLFVLTYMTVNNFKKEITAKSRKKNEGMTLLISLYAFLPPIIFACFVK